MTASTTTPLARPGTLAPGAESLASTSPQPSRGPVLLASTGQSRTDATYQVTAALSARIGARVEVASVIEPYPAYMMGAEMPLYPPAFEPAQRAALEADIRAHLAEVGGSAEQWPVSVLFGDPAGTIARVAKEHDASMIVVGLGQHRVRDRLLGGERALQVLRAADRPVLAVAPEQRTLPRTVVVGMDFSPASVCAARAALGMIADEGRMVMVHVRPPGRRPRTWTTSELSDSAYEQLLERWSREARAEIGVRFARLRDELRPLARATVTIETQTHTGTVLEQLLGVADAIGAEMIAVGTHGPGALERLLIGSVATSVLRTSGRTVLVSPAPEAAEAARLALRIQGTALVSTSDDWAAVLKAFSGRNAGRRVTLEVDDPSIGAQVEQSGFALLGASYDHRDRRVELMMGDPAQNTVHLTRTIPAVDDVAIYATPAGRECALRVSSGRGQTLLTFME